MTLLFDIPEQQPVKTEKRCRDCKHIRHHQYTDKINYCAVKLDKHTGTGLKKVKRLDNICEQFEAKSNV